MDKALPTIVVAALVVLILVGMFFGWRARQKRQADLVATKPVPTDLGQEFLTTDLFYVATTIADEPLNRVSVSGLGYRARASVTVAEHGIVLAIAGQPETFLPREDLTRVERATWTIDRVVESGGLVRVTWMLGDTAVDSYLRVVQPPDPAALIDGIERIIVGAPDREGSR